MCAQIFEFLCIKFLISILTNKAVIADLSANAGVLIQRVLSADSEFGSVRSRGPCQLNTGVQFIVDLVEDGSIELLAIFPVILQNSK